MRKSIGHSQQLSPNTKARNPHPNPLTFSQNNSPSASPIKYLLQNNIKMNMGKEGQRGEEQLQVVGRLLRECTIFNDLDISIEDHSIFKELCNGILLIYCESPHIMEIKDNQVYIFFQGQGFQYMQNTFQTQFSKRYKIYENNEYVMLHKILTNEYFLSLPQMNGRYHATRKKYQLMVDQNTLLGKISEELFSRIFMPKIVERQKATMNFLKKVSIFNGLPNSFFNQFSKFLQDQEAEADDKIIERGDKSKYVYFIKSGEVQVKSFPELKGKLNTNYYVSPSKPYNSEKLGEYDSFGMEELEMVDNFIDKEVVCLKNSKFYKIQKRLLAIIITSFELEFKQKSKVWSQVNINNQIKGQNYCTPEQNLLLKNAERIRTSERKARDLKLRYYASSKKSVKEVDVAEKAQKEKKEKEEVEQKQITVSNSRVFSPEEKRRMIKTTDGRFRSTSIMKYINTFGDVKGVLDEPKYDSIKKQLHNQKVQDNEDKIVNNYELMTLEQESREPSPKLRQSNAFSYKDKMETIKFTRSLSRSAKMSVSHKFVPKLQSRLQDNRQYERYNSDLIGFYLDKKIKNEIVKKAEKVVNMNKNTKLTQNKNIKRLFSSRECKAISAMNDIDKKTIASDIVERMSNMRDNPLLLQVENERRKLERQMKQIQRRAKPTPNLPKKIKKEDLHILIKNNDEK